MLVCLLAVLASLQLVLGICNTVYAGAACWLHTVTTHPLRCKPCPQFSFYAAATVAPPPGPPPRDACAPGARATAGGWAAAGRPARLLVTEQGRLSLSFPGGEGRLEYTPEEGGSRWC